MCILVCIAYGMTHCTLEYAPYFLYGIQVWMSDRIPQDNNVALCEESLCLLRYVPRCLVQYQDRLAYLPAPCPYVPERTVPIRYSVKKGCERAAERFELV